MSADIIAGIILISLFILLTIEVNKAGKLK